MLLCFQIPATVYEDDRAEDTTGFRNGSKHETVHFILGQGLAAEKDFCRPPSS